MKDKDAKEKKHYPNKPKSDIVHIPTIFRQEYLSAQKNKEVLDIPITALRIIIKVLSNLKYDQFQRKKQPAQFMLFEEEFRTEHNTYARFTFKQSEISLSRNVKNIEDALIFLKKYKEQIYKSKNAQGKWIKSHGGLIKDFTLSEGDISFLIPSYWLERLVHVPGYNPALYEIVWHFSSTKHYLFFLYILELEEGTRARIAELQKTYNLNYSDKKDFAKFFLKPIKKKLDEFSNKTFNYSIDGDCVNLSVQEQVPPVNTKKLSEVSITALKIRKKAHYWRDRHKLNELQYKLIKDTLTKSPIAYFVMDEAYKRIVKKYRTEKVKITVLKGVEFIEEFQEFINSFYKETTYDKLSPEDRPILLDIS